MGLLRLYLALCVVANHAGRVLPWSTHDGAQAVQIFYIISGFYMALVLSTKYGNARDFYASRFLRIFPPYWVALGVTLVISLIPGCIAQHWLQLEPYASAPLKQNGALGFGLAALSNLTLFGQDWTLFLSHPAGGALAFTDNFKADASPLWHYVLIPPCWSVALELTFYLLVPFLNRARTSWLTVLLLFTIALRFAAYRWLHWNYDPWTYRFFPFELSQFLLGMIGYRVYAKFLRPRTPSGFQTLGPAGYVVGIGLLLLALYGGVLGLRMLQKIVGHDLARLVTYPAWGLAGLPVLFFIFGGVKADRLIGELSYPVYLLHYTVAAALETIMAAYGVSLWLGPACAVVTIALAILCYRGVIAPLDRKRRRFADRSP